MAADPPGQPGNGHPLLGLALWQPQLLVDHAAACTELFLAEGEIAIGHWQQQLLWAVLATAGLVLACTLAGTGLMLWAALPTGSLPHAEWLWLVPMPPLLLGLVAAMRASRASPPAFALLRQQVVGDLQRLRDAAAGTCSP